MVFEASQKVYPYEFPFNIISCEIIEDETPHITASPISQNYSFEYITKGEGTLICNDKVYHLERGDLFILQKGSNYQYFSDMKKPWNRIKFSADGILISNLIVSYGLLDTVVVKGFNGEAKFREMFELFKKIPDETSMCGAGLKLHDILQKIYITLNRNLPTNSAVAIKKILDSNIFKNDFSMKDVSKVLGISKAQIINIFREKYGSTPYKYFIEQRIKMSTEMLINTEMSIKEISDTLCFSDQHYYANVFKRIIGISPNQFRKEQNELYKNSGKSV